MVCGRDQHQMEPGIQRGRAAATLLLKAYARLNARGEHLLSGPLAGASPRQWQHYPIDDAIDERGGLQWFYHSHSPDDRPDGAEHGHIHLFARRRLWARRMRSKAEQDFAAMTGAIETDAQTRHLIGIGLNPKGIPVTLFTTNSWVTGDLMLSAATTERLLAGLTLDTGFADVDAVITATLGLCGAEIRQLLAERDARLQANPRLDKLQDRSLDVLSEVAIDLDRKLAAFGD